MTNQTTSRIYTLYVCSLCGSDDVMSNDEDSYCNECREWMNTVPIQLVPASTGKESG